MPLLLPLAVPFFALIAALVLAGLSKSAAAQHGSSNSGTFWDTITGRTYLNQLAGFASDFAHWIVSHFAASQLRLLTRWLTAMGTLTGGWFVVEAEYAEAVAGALERIEHRGDPKARAKAAKAAGAAGAAAALAHKAGRHANQVGNQLNTYKGHTNTTLRHHGHAISVTLPRDIGRVRTREGELSRDLGKLRDRTKALEDGATKTFRWIRAHPQSAATGVFAAAVGIALARLGLGNLRCNNFKRLLGRYGCGLGHLLESLLGLAISALALENVCTLLPVLETAFGEVVGPVTHLLTEVPLGGCEKPPKAWAQLSVAAGPLPPPQTLGKLPG